MAFQIAKRVAGARWAVDLAAPTAWSKLHDEIKIYGGYLRFVVPFSLVAARAMYYSDLSWAGPRAPAFNVSAAIAIVVLLIFEVLEDQVSNITNYVIREVKGPCRTQGEDLKHGKTKGPHPKQKQYPQAVLTNPPPCPCLNFAIGCAPRAAANGPGPAGDDCWCEAP